MANNNTDEKTTGLSRATTDKGIKVFCLYDDLVDLNQIKPNPKNPNKHPEEQVKLLAEIIKKNGWRQPITVSKRSGFIVKGHARREAGILAGGGALPWNTRTTRRRPTK